MLRLIQPLLLHYNSKQYTHLVLRPLEWPVCVCVYVCVCVCVCVCACVCVCESVSVCVCVKFLNRKVISIALFATGHSQTRPTFSYGSIPFQVTISAAPRCVYFPDIILALDGDHAIQRKWWLAKRNIELTIVTSLVCPRRPCQQKHLYANVQLLVHLFSNNQPSSHRPAKPPEWWRPHKEQSRTVQFPLGSDLPGWGNWIPTDYENTKHECFPGPGRARAADRTHLKIVLGFCERVDTAWFFPFTLDGTVIFPCSVAG